MPWAGHPDHAPGTDISRFGQLQFNSSNSPMGLNLAIDVPPFAVGIDRKARTVMSCRRGMRSLNSAVSFDTGN
jgi:hypothetical protein